MFAPTNLTEFTTKDDRKVVKNKNMTPINVINNLSIMGYESYQKSVLVAFSERMYLPSNTLNKSLRMTNFFLDFTSGHNCGPSLNTCIVKRKPRVILQPINYLLIAFVC